MAEDGYSSSTWETTDNSDINSSNYNHGLPQSRPAALDNIQGHTSIPPTPSKSVSPPPRSSSDSVSRWHDGSVTLERHDTTLSTIPSETVTLLEPTFDENVLRALCELDVSFSDIYLSLSPGNSSLYSLQCGVPLLLDRIKQSMVSCRVRLFASVLLSAALTFAIGGFCIFQEKSCFGRRVRKKFTKAVAHFV